VQVRDQRLKGLCGEAIEVVLMKSFIPDETVAVFQPLSPKGSINSVEKVLH